MEVTGIHGTYTMTCNDVMEVILTCSCTRIVRNYGRKCKQHVRYSIGLCFDLVLMLTFEN